DADTTKGAFKGQLACPFATGADPAPGADVVERRAAVIAVGHKGPVDIERQLAGRGARADQVIPLADDGREVLIRVVPVAADEGLEAEPGARDPRDLVGAARSAGAVALVDDDLRERA